MHLADRVRLMEEELDTLRKRIDCKTREFQEILEQVVGPA
jgi:hypothetical protein